MKLSRALVWLLAPVCCLAQAAPARATEEAGRFLERLHERGYGEATLDYLNYLKRIGHTPEEIAANWDLYQARGWRMSINEAFNAKEVEERTAEAKKFLDKYLKDHPDSAEAGEEVAEWGDLAFKRGLRIFGQSKLSKDKEKQAALIVEAGAAFEEGRPRFTQSIQMLSQRVTQLRAAAAAAAPEQPKRGARGKVVNAKQKAAEQALEEAELLWSDAQLKLARLDFFVAQTYADDASEEGKKTRKELLERAVAQFYDIYQRYRNGVLGLLAHTWEGKTREELGDLDTAQEVYEEVLVLMPDLNQIKGVDRAQQNMFAQVQYFNSLIQLKHGQDGLKQFVPEAQQWLKNYKEWSKADGYQGVTLELAKAYLDQAEKVSPEQKVKLRKEAAAMLNEMKKIPSEHHQEAMALLKSLGKGSGGGGPAKTYDEAIANGDDFFEAKNFVEAAKSYQAAVDFAKKLSGPKGKDSLSKAEEKLNTCKYNEIYLLYSSGKEDEALAKADELEKSDSLDPKGDTAASLATLRVQVVLRKYAGEKHAAAKDELLTSLTSAASDVIKNWPDKAAADDARIALAQANLVQAKPQEAIEAFEAVNPRSERYPLALYMAGQTHWRVYSIEKQKSPDDRDAKLMQAELAAVVEDMQKTIELQTKGIAPGQALPQQLVDGELLLSQAYLDAGEPQKAADLLQPVVEAIKNSKPEQLDRTMLSVFNNAVKSCVAVGDMTKGGEIATVLTELGADTPEIDSVLVTFARMLDFEYKQASAALIEARAENDPAAKEAAEKRVEGTKKLLADLLKRLAPREHNAPRSMISIGDMATAIGETDLASELYNRILSKAESDPQFNEEVSKGLVRVRAQLVDLLRQKGQYAEGVKQADALIAEVPKAIEPLMTKGRLLQAWADKEPEKFNDAVAHWASVRQKLQQIVRKGGPADLQANYYEANYYVAQCLLKEAEKTSNPNKAVDAQKVLNALLITSPKLDGPETVAKYRDLMKKAGEFAKKNGKAAPPTGTAAAAKT